METIDLGEIKLPSRIKVTDPCYPPTEWCCNEINILPGMYKCEAIQKRCGEWGNRIAEVILSRLKNGSIRDTTELFLLLPVTAS